MKVTYTTNNGKYVFEFESDTQTGLVEQMAEVDEIFGDTTCCKNGEESEDVKWVVREVDGNKYYELHYCGTNPKLFGVKKSFGQTRTGNRLFPRRKDSDGNYLADNGWVRYNKDTGKEE